MSDKPHEIEFEIGQLIHYKPYEESNPRRVVGIKPHQNIWGAEDVRVWYELCTLEEFVRGRKFVCTETTGKCIEESIYFEEHKNEAL